MTGLLCVLKIQKQKFVSNKQKNLKSPVEHDNTDSKKIKLNVSDITKFF